MVTPPPDTEMVTGVGSDTGLVTMSKRPVSVLAGTLANSPTPATAGLLLVTRRSWSWPAIEPVAMVTIP